MDQDFLYRVYAGSRMAELAPLGWSEDRLQTFLKMQFDAQSLDYGTRYPNARFEVILGDQDPIGRLYVDRRKAEIRILDICLLPEHRNQGLGTPLVQELLHEAGEAGKTLGICVESYNPSLRLFERLGFTAVDEDGPLLLLEWSPPLKSPVNS